VKSFSISFSGPFKININQQTLINFSKPIISSYFRLLFTEAREVSFTRSEGTTEITNTIISVKSIVPKDENDWAI
jgi:hypothetical protein